MRATTNKYTKIDVTLQMSGEEAKRILSRLKSANREHEQLTGKGDFRFHRLFNDLLDAGNEIGRALQEADENIIPVDDFENAAFKYRFEEDEND